MRLNIVRDVFEPVVERIKSQCDSGRLGDFLNEFYAPNVPDTAGIEGWFTVQVILTLGENVKTMNLTRGPDLGLRNAGATMWLELKGAANLDRKYLRDGATKYCAPKYDLKYPNFVGCLFLGDGGNKGKIDELSGGDVELIKRETIPEGERTWVVGLLATSKSRRKLN